MTNLWERNIWYSLLRPIVDTCTRFSYRRAEVHGLENIPQDAAVIFAPNHCNCLMDALVVLRSRKSPTVFGARADLFDNKTVAAILNMLRILPMVRRRDGIRKVLRNYESFDSAIEVLGNGVPFCIFAEGRHRPMHSLLPLGKGIFRIAVGANEKFEGKKRVVVVPVGLEYGDYYRYRSTSLVNFGKPIDVTAFIAEHPDMLDGELYHSLITMLQDSLKELIVWFPDDEQCAGREKAFNAARERRPFESLLARFKRDKALAEDIMNGVPHSAPKAFSRPVKWALALLLLPLFLVSAVLSLPMWAGAEWMISKKMKDRTWGNTVRFAFKLMGSVILGIVWAVVFYTKLPWLVATAALLLFFCSMSIVYDYLNLLRR